MNNHVDAGTLKMEDLRPLPPVVVEFLRGLDASPRLLAHLVLVHDVAARLLEAQAETWPHLPIDAGAVLSRCGDARYRQSACAGGVDRPRNNACRAGPAA